MIAHNAYRILENAYSDVCSHAEQVGIDGAQLLANLPQPGTLLKGADIPVLSRADRGKTSVVFHVNRNRQGTEWPFLQFQTFRHGGAKTQFHGLNWLRQHANDTTKARREPTAVAVRTKAQDELSDHQYRLNRHDKLTFSYAHGTPLTADDRWLRRRYAGWMTDTVLRRIAGRQVTGNRVLFPLGNHKEAIVGYQQVMTDGSAQKRTFLRATGQLAGSFILVSASPTSQLQSTVLCEGITTALAIARVWQGPVVAALTANNLRNVRNQLSGPVIIAMDDDCWKPWAGNTGWAAAEAAQDNGDRIVKPRFRLNSLRLEPTDFNDLLALEGPQAVKACFE